MLRQAAGVHVCSASQRTEGGTGSVPGTDVLADGIAFAAGVDMSAMFSATQGADHPGETAPTSS
ncbi:hypothetical protein INR49_004909 [Caranx melampygus]|nr:hypothetical protein INR49_004909 [Caranx melampygus]